MGQDREHARHLCRISAVDALQEAVRDLAADHDCIGLARQVLVIRVTSFAAQEGRILHARDRLADTELHQGGVGGEGVHRITSYALPTARGPAPPAYCYARSVPKPT